MDMNGNTYRYQEALDTLEAIPIGDCFLLDYKSIKGCGCQLETGKAIETLQELISKYEILEKALDIKWYIDITKDNGCVDTLNKLRKENVELKEELKKAKDIIDGIY